MCHETGKNVMNSYLKKEEVLGDLLNQLLTHILRIEFCKEDKGNGRPSWHILVLYLWGNFAKHQKCECTISIIPCMLRLHRSRLSGIAVTFGEEMSLAVSPSPFSPSWARQNCSWSPGTVAQSTRSPGAQWFSQPVRRGRAQWPAMAGWIPTQHPKSQSSLGMTWHSYRGRVFSAASLVASGSRVWRREGSLVAKTVPGRTLFVSLSILYTSPYLVPFRMNLIFYLILCIGLYRLLTSSM